MINIYTIQYKVHQNRKTNQGGTREELQIRHPLHHIKLLDHYEQLC